VLRRWLLSVPLLAGVTAAAGAAFADRPATAVLLSALAGLALAAGLAKLGDHRARAVAGRVERLADGDTATRLEPSGSREWRRLLDSLNAVGSSLERRFRDLASERERVERLLDTLPTAVLLFTSGGLVYANPAGRAMFGVLREEPRTPLQVLGVPGLADAVAEAAETGGGVEVEVDQDDRELLARALVTADGEVALVVTDLTATRRVERVRRDFVTNASHELKTPVAGIQALSDSLGLALTRDPERARVMVDRLQREAARLGQLVRDLLDLARLEEAAGEGRRQGVDVAEMVRAQAERLGGVAAERGIEIVCECDEPALVVALPGDLRLVVSNLLENAVRYNRDGGQVRARVRREGSSVEIAVSDTGAGIPEADRDRIFERFYRVDKGRSRLEGGTGLGLAIVRHALARHGGSIRVDSVLGTGSTFTVTLPVEGSD
jgi:signal transduction histidine kinase